MTSAARQRPATLTIRNVDPRLKEQLRVRAAQHGHSMEAELHDILRLALGAKETEQRAAEQDAPEESLAEAIRRRMAPFHGVQLEPHPPVLDDEPPFFER